MGLLAENPGMGWDTTGKGVGGSGAPHRFGESFGLFCTEWVNFLAKFGRNCK